MKSYPNFLFLFSILFIGACQQKNLPEDKWIQLFNGKNLDGWIVKISGFEPGVNYKNTFRVQAGLLTVNYGEYEKWNNEFGHLFYKRSYTYYRLRIEYRFVGEQVPGGQTWAHLNSGVMLHSQSPESMEITQNFPISIEMQFLASTDSTLRTTANLATPGSHVFVGDTLYTNHMYYSNSPNFANYEWVTAEAIVLGDSIVHHLVNGDTVLTYTHPHIGGWELADQNGWVEDKTWVTQMTGNPLKKGYISLQAESHPVQFRKVELLDLSENFK